MKPKFTIVIPTRERADVLYYCLKSACAQDYPNLEILVSDNFSQDNTRAIVKNFSDDRIRYVNTGKRVSMSHNWEFAISHVDEGWITILGDDDALLPGAIQRVLQMAATTGVKAIRSKTCQYAWPSLRGKQYGQLNVSLGSGYELRNSKHWISKVLTGDAIYTELPMLYNGGFIDVSVLQAIKRVTGSLYLSMTPDVYSGFAIAHLSTEYLYCQESLAVNGASIHSNGSAQFTLKGEDYEKPMALFISEPNIPFHHEVALPKGMALPKCLQIYVYEAYLQSLPLATSRDSNADARKQLEIILVEASRSRQNISAWVRGFCTLHDIEVPKSTVSTSRLTPHLLQKICRSKIAQLPDCVITGSKRRTLDNVYEASIEARSLIDNPPPIALRIIRNGFDLLRRLICR
jgi:glycosyltransferase involved in cell wall biosynthesis